MLPLRPLALFLVVPIPMKSKTPFQVHILIALMGLIALSAQVHSQELTKIRGLVRDAVTGDTLPFVNVYFKDTQIGTTTGFDGKFSLESRKATDTLVASFVGYIPQSIAIKKNTFQNLDILLEPNSYQLNEIVIRPGENPAIVLLRKVVDHKPDNDPDKVEAFQCKAYTKMQVDINNITDKFKNRKVLEPFKFIFEQVDTSVVNGKAYLPAMISETFSDVYFRRSPRARKEIITASQISGIDNATVSQFLGNMVQDINIYDNFINLFQKNFPSPISNIGQLYYKYYLVDSTFIGNSWCYNIMFKPKRKQEYAFTGNIWIHDTTYAVKQYQMRMVDDANINFINDLVLQQEFQRTPDGKWVVHREQTTADFNIVEEAKKTLGFYGTRTIIFSDYKFDQADDSKIYSMPNNIVVLEGSNKKTDEFWKQSRPEALTHRESAVYRMADTLQKIPLFNSYLDVIQMITTGYYVKGLMEWGPYASIFSMNANEGYRFRLGGRTSNDFSKKIMFDGYLAYGTYDRTLKYKIGYTQMLGKFPDRVLKASHTYDMEQLGTGGDAFREDFILNSIFRRNPQNRLALVSDYTVSYKHDWFTGFSNTLTFTNRSIFTLGGNNITVFDAGAGEYITKEHITTSDISLDLHYGYHEKVLGGEFDRTTISAPYPVLDMRYTRGFKGLIGSDYAYDKLQVRVSHWFNVFSAGYFSYSLEAGKTWGKLPFPLLKVYPGNETFYGDDRSFNLMNYYEFISDEYAVMYLSHHFEGLFLNRIPLIRKLKWREVASLRMATGHTSDINKSYNPLPTGSYFIAYPYTEVGVGVEKILRFIRVDAVWRLFYNDHPNTNRFGLMVSMNFDF